MINLTFGIIGYGIVGKATQLALLKDQKVIIHDINLGTNQDDILLCDYVFICIPTTSPEEISAVINLTKELKNKKSSIEIIFRSTVPIGTCKSLKEQDGIDVCYMPEFLRDRYWDTDCLTYPLLVGGDLDISMLSIQNNVIRCDNDLLEVVKMFSNNINVLKIVFANHFYDISQVVGCDYTKVVELWNQVRTEQSYLEANENLRGFDGKCLPKDLNFLIDTFKQLNIEQELFTSLKKDNAKWPKHIRKS